MVVICLGPICVPLWPVIALTVKPLWDRFIPDSFKGKLDRSWTKVRSYICPARKKADGQQPVKHVKDQGDTDRIIKISSDQEYRTLISGPRPVLVKFTADFCGPCKTIAPHVSELASRFSDQITFCEVDIEEFDDIALSAGVSSIPAFNLFMKGKKSDQVIGTNVPKLIELCENAAQKTKKRPVRERSRRKLSDELVHNSNNEL